MKRLNKKADENNFGGIGFVAGLSLIILILAVLLIAVAPKVIDNFKSANKCSTSKGICSDELSGSPTTCPQGDMGQKDCKEGYLCCAREEQLG